MGRSDASYVAERDFIDSLADPAAVHELALSGRLTDSAFVDYLQQLLRVWSQPAWRCCLRHPLALQYLGSLVDGGGLNVGFVGAAEQAVFPLDQRARLAADTRVVLTKQAPA